MAENVMLVTRHRFWLDDRGDRRRIAALVRFLMRQFRLTVAYVGKFGDEDQKAVDAEYRDAAWFVIQPEQEPPPMPEQPTLDDYYSESNRVRFQQLLRRLAPDCLIVEYMRVAYLIDGIEDKLRGRCLTVIDTMDVCHRRCEAFNQRGEAHWVEITEQEEREVLDRFDIVTAIQDQDAEVFRGMLPDKRVITVGHHLPLVRHQPSERPWVDIGFVAGTAAPNRLGIDEFLKSTWPALRERHGEGVRLTLVGAICEHLRDAVLPEGVVLRGHVPDLSAAYADLDIVINPVTFGGGLKIKCVEALCHGRVLVTTSAGAQGIESGAGRAFFVCDGEEKTLRTLSSLIENKSLREEVSARAHRFARERFSEEAAYDELSRTLTEWKPRRAGLLRRATRALRSAFLPPLVRRA
jgi:hypothetical protein